MSKTRTGVSQVAKAKKSWFSLSRVVGMLLLVILAGSLTINVLLFKKIGDYRNDPQKLLAEKETRLLDKVRRLYQFPTYVEKIDNKDVTKEDMSP